MFMVDFGNRKRIGAHWVKLFQGKQWPLQLTTDIWLFCSILQRPAAGNQTGVIPVRVEEFKTAGESEDAFCMNVLSLSGRCLWLTDEGGGTISTHQCAFTSCQDQCWKLLKVTRILGTKKTTDFTFFMTTYTFISSLVFYVLLIFPLPSRG